MGVIGRLAAAAVRRTRHWRPSAVAQRRRLDRESERLVGEVEGRGFETSDSFKDYLYAQIRRSLPISQPQPGQPMIERTRYLISLLRAHLRDDERVGTSVLCVGCRDGRELDALQSVVGPDGQVTGLDLFAQDPRIQVGDMHEMPFDDARFDGLYSSHNLEHAYDLERAVGQYLRVVRPGGWLIVEVPVRFEPTATDWQDVGSADGLVERFGAAVAEVLVCEENTRQVRGLEKTSARMLVRLGAKGSPS
ncbi:MAG: class I SAM-dependent methyltransferase [Acidobacteriota bacterium]